MKIALIGGGSGYTPELMQGMMEKERELGIGECVLHDPDAERLEAVAGFSKRMARAAGSGIEIKSTTRLEHALRGADFIVAQIRVGGNRARMKDEMLGIRHNLVGQETTGVGGLAKALRTVPAMIEIARAAEQHAPDALLINFTNPSGLVTEAVLKHSAFPCIGLCNIPVTFHIEVAKALGASRREVELDYVGINHLSWVRKVLLRGEDVTEKIISWAGSDEGSRLEELEYPPGFLKALKMIPMHYLRYYYMTRLMIAEQKKKKRTRAEQVIEIEKDLFRIYRDPKADRKPELLSKRGGANYSLAALELIEATVNDSAAVQVLNVMNNGAIEGLPADSVVELKCRAGRGRAEPLSVGRVEPGIMGLIRAVKAYEELAIEAAVERSYDKTLLALVAHPLGPEADHAKAVLDDIMEAHGLDLN